MRPSQKAVYGTQGRRLLALRAAWMVVLLLALAITAASTPIMLEQYGTLCYRASESCLESSQLTPEGLRELERFGFSLGMIGAQVYRYHSVSGPDQRRQTRWVVFGTALALSLLLALLVPLFLFLPGMAEASPFVLLLIGYVLPLVMLLIPLSVGMAMLRSGPFDIDLVINRTLVYGALTATLALVYLGSVASLQYALRILTGQNSTLAVVASTLVIAALFNPLRRRIQALVDRRFYRKKYDARKTLEGLSIKLRDETDLEDLTGELTGITRETMQPAHVSVWLRGPASHEGRGRND